MPAYRPELADLVKEILAHHPVNGRPMNPNEAQTRTEISHTNIRDMTKGRVPRRDTLHKFAKGFDMPRSGLLKAAGYTPTEEDLEWDRERYPDQAMPPPEDDSGTPTAELLREEMTSLLKRLPHDFLGWFRVPVVATASAGRARWTQPSADPVEEREFPRVRIEGDSMAPVFPHGSEVEIVYGTNVEARHGDYVIAVRADAPVFKQLFIEKQGKAEVLVLHPINPDFDDEIIRLDEEFFMIAGVARRVVDVKEHEQRILLNEHLVQQNKEQTRELSAKDRELAAKSRETHDMAWAHRKEAEEKDRALEEQARRIAELEAELRKARGEE